MKLIYTFTFLFIFGFTLSLCGQIGMKFIGQNERVQSLVFTKKNISNNVRITTSLQYSSYINKKTRSGGEVILIWTGAGLAGGFLTGFIFGLTQGSYDITKEETALIYGTYFGLIGGTGGAIIGLGKAFSIWGSKPREQPKVRF